MQIAERRRDASLTRERILRAAQSLFSARAYAEVGVREITSAADVNAALVNRYFGSKEKLFEEALTDILDINLLTWAEKSTFGKDIAAMFFSASRNAIHPLPMLVLATSDPTAREIALRLLKRLVVKPLAAWFGTDDGEERSARVMAISTGFFTYRLLLPLKPFQGAASPETRRWLERALQAAIDD